MAEVTPLSHNGEQPLCGLPLVSEESMRIWIGLAILGGAVAQQEERVVIPQIADGGG